MHHLLSGVLDKYAIIANYYQLTGFSCSFIHFALRCFAQYGALTPKPEAWRQVQHPLGLLVGTNLFCLVMHIWLSRPTATSLGTGGYLHGSLLIDFVGQKGPTSKALLVLLDLLVLVLQMLCLGSVDASRRAAVRSETAMPVQDVEAEERGEHAPVTPRGDDIEMHDLGIDNSGSASVRHNAHDDYTYEHDDYDDNINDDEDREALLTSDHTQWSNYIEDAFASGTMMITDVGIMDVITRHLSGRREQRTDSDDTHRASRPRMRLRFRLGNRTWGV